MPCGLMGGVERCRKSEQERARVEWLVEPMHLLPFDRDSARCAARIRWRLERMGRPVGPYDLLIAALALTLDVTLITHNTREFGRIEGLRTEDWQV